MDVVLQITDVEHIKVLMDRNRQKVMSVLKEQGRPMTVKQIADMLEESPAKVHFHLHKLVDIGVLRLEHTEVVHGIVAKYFEPTAAIIKFMPPELDEVTCRNVDSSFTHAAAAVFTQALRDFSENCALNARVPSRLTYLDVYLTPQEAADFNQHLDDFAAEHQNAGKEGCKRFKVFVSSIADERESKSK